MKHRGDSAIALVDTLIKEAIERAVSDVHLEACKEHLRVRFRIDGMLYDQTPMQSTVMHQVVSRIKVLANIDIAQKRIPQDGTFHVMHKDGHQVDVRVSTFPSLFGQKVVMRLLDHTAEAIALEQLGMDEALQTKVMQLMQQPQGFFLVTGPTGSGKTTTLYAGLHAMNRPEKNIVTLEDPIEYHIEGITQGQIHPEVGFTFEKGMRHLLRQDPDVVMVGEIRDAQTAAIAVQAAMTGHTVLSTIHTNDAASVIMRLMDMGIAPFLLNASLNGVLAQRLARRLCAVCKTSRTPTAYEKELGLQHGVELKELYAPVGCDACFGIGYKGRVGIFECIIMDNTLRSLVTDAPSIDAIKHQAQEAGMQTLLQHGMQKVAEGVLSLEELLRVIS